jgi:hypothetical protein
MSYGGSSTINLAMFLHVVLVLVARKNDLREHDMYQAAVG